MWTHRFSQPENVKSKSRSTTFCFTAFQPNLALSTSHWASKQLFCSLLFTHSAHMSLQNLASSRFTSSVPRIFSWLDHHLISHCQTTTSLLPTSDFLTAFPRLSTPDSSVNNITFQNNRARCKEHRIMPESFRVTLLALQPQITDPKPPFICLTPSGGNLTTKSRSSPSYRKNPIYFPLSQVCSVCAFKNANSLKQKCDRAHSISLQ